MLGSLFGQGTAGRSLKVNRLGRLLTGPASTHVQRRTLIAPALPTPIADYVEANARLDVDGMLKPLAADAVIHDNGGVHQGLGEIRSSARGGGDPRQGDLHARQHPARERPSRRGRPRPR